MDEWQALYDWACSQPAETSMDGEWWWNACLMNIVAKALKGTSGVVSKGELRAPTPDNQWKSDLLTALYSVLFPTHELTIGQFKGVLEKVRPHHE